MNNINQESAHDPLTVCQLGPEEESSTHIHVTKEVCRGHNENQIRIVTVHIIEIERCFNEDSVHSLVSHSETIDTD
jgi:hypothetical protein